MWGEREDAQYEELSKREWTREQKKLALENLKKFKAIEDAPPKIESPKRPSSKQRREIERRIDNRH